ncbi:MAG: hypothetical protein K0S45_1022 [Nitrospira sp.]|jgi:hypothetical protein|nr:hypothetical protein [Nitrospira sp.]
MWGLADPMSRAVLLPVTAGWTRQTVCSLSLEPRRGFNRVVVALAGPAGQNLWR